MSPYRTPMPSFSLVLTSDYPPIRSAIIQLSPSMLPTAPDSLMKTIDLRRRSACDEFVEEDVESQTIFAAERTATFDHGAEAEVGQPSLIMPVKRKLLLFIHRLVSYKRKFTTFKKD